MIERTSSSSGTVHVALVRRPFAGLILSGEKRIEVRLSKHRIAPFGRVAAGDVVFVKQVGGPFVARALVGNVEAFEELTPERIRRLASCYGRRAHAPDAFWVDRRRARFGTIVHFGAVEPVDEGPAYARSRSAWHVLGPVGSVGLAA